MEFESAFQLALNKSIAFVIYREPGTQNPIWLFSKDTPKAEAQFEMKSGFWMHPFVQSKETPAFCTQPDFEFEGWNLPDDIEDLLHSADQKSESISAPIEISHTEYISQLEKGIDFLKEGKLKKFIFSRVKTQENSTAKTIQAFRNLERLYPDAFVYFIQHPRYGSWMGATPETLIHHQNQTAQTVALAGTQPLNTSYTWGEKEQEEQALVTEFIESTLAQHQVTPTKKGPFTVEAGKVAHIKTELSWQTQNHDTAYWSSLINDLHPTPAVCGLPRNKAFDYIKELEPQDRRYYSGFLGRIHDNKKFKLYVNLRCMEVFENVLALRLGGGITARSVAEDEWLETEEKAKTLLAALQ